MNIIYTFMSIVAMVLQNALQNVSGKKLIKKTGDIYYFNIFIAVVSLVLTGVLMLFGGHVSLFTAIVGGIYGAGLLVCTATKTNALTCGPLHLTMLMCASSTIIPSMSGALFFGETFSFLKLIGILLLLFFVYLSLKPDKREEHKISKKWLVFALITFVLQGTLGVIQKVHQTSVYKEETTGFLLVAFIFSLLFMMVMSKKSEKSGSYNKGFYIMAIICGLTTFTMNYVNLILSGRLPSQIMFPLINGSEFIFTAIMSIVLFKEKVSVRQVIGLAGGLASLMMICLV